MQSLISTDSLPDNLLSAIGNRDISLWLHRVPNSLDAESIADFIKLPWREVFITDAEPDLIRELGRDSDADLVRKRGFLQLIQSDPSQIVLPPRSLPVYLLDGEELGDPEFDRILRHMSMLGELRRSNIRRVLVISDEDATPPQELSGLLDASFHPYITFVSATERGTAQASAWSESTAAGPPKQLVRLAPVDFVQQLTRRYSESYIDDTTLIRMRTARGNTVLVDLSDADDIERPILTYYDIIKERDLASVSPEELTEDEFSAFFEGGQSSWRPFAARVPWPQDQKAFSGLEKILHQLDTVGASENKIAYIASEPGAGGTTLARQLAWMAASQGYPTLVAKSVPFLPDALSVVGFLNRTIDAAVSPKAEASSPENDNIEERHLYETPWVIVFDRSHWEQREGELRHFLAEIQRSGRPAAVLLVTGPFKPLSLYVEAVATEIAVLTHIIDASDAIRLGRHLNVFLRAFGKDRPSEEWMRFYQQHNVRHLGSRTAFWVALSFWLRTSQDISGTIQEWIYRIFTEYAESPEMKCALIEIAALSSERFSMSERLLPLSNDNWPLALKLEDNSRNLAALGLGRVLVDGEKYWGLAHDILGRLLINALFHDYSARVELGYGEARDAEHLRFLALKRIAVKSAMAETRHRALADEFATTIFKVDPAHGAHAFAGIWREVLQALDQMPKLVRDGSRLFRHHTAISRRRIATLEGAIYNVRVEDQLVLLERAVDDIEYAITSVDRMPGDEPDLNLYNSLANAYLNLADVKALTLAPREEIMRLRVRANEATHRAYGENPTNPFVVETHIKNLLSIARAEPEGAVSSCLEALQAIYEALRGENVLLRTPQLARLAEQAMDILFANAPSDSYDTEPQTTIDVLLWAWRILSSVDSTEIGGSLADLPLKTANEALTVLEHPAGKGDIQVLRLRYGILSAVRPIEFRNRIDLLENLQATDTRLSPQLRLEYALLLYQVGRAVEGDERFLYLRRLWHNSEHFVRVPRPLDWLRDGESETLLTVQAIVGSDQSHRPMAKVHEFGNKLAPFRPEEFDVRAMRPGYRFRAQVSFGHNGPFLRPLGARPRRG